MCGVCSSHIEWLLLGNAWTRAAPCRLADFGLSRVLDMNATHVSTQSFGTVPYMPPELLSQGRMTTKVDVYSFAILSAFSLRRTAQVSGFLALCLPFCACQLMPGSISVLPTIPCVEVHLLSAVWELITGNVPYSNMAFSQVRCGTRPCLKQP